MKKIYIGIIMVGMMLGVMTTSCSGFLDVSKELSEEQDMVSIFSTPSEVRRFHRNLYTGIPNSMNLTWWSAMVAAQGTSNVWALLSDDMCKQVDIFPYTRPLAPNDVIISRWSYYQLIRQANIFLEKAKEIPLSGSADFLGSAELGELRGEARFFRAYYHYLMFEIYGPIPIMDKAADPGNPNLDFARNSVDEVVNFIYNELTQAANELKDPDLSYPDRLGVPTKGTALAIRGRLMMYAASPLFNGGFTEALSLTNNDGKRLFPDRDPNKWQKALNAMQEFIDYANDGNYELHKEMTAGVLDPDKSIYEVFMKMNKEIIFARSEDISNSAANFLDTRNVPRGARGGSTTNGGAAITQELVDAFFMRDGLSIDESPLYVEDGYSVAGDDPTPRTEVGTRKMFINREPRFYQTVFYNGRKWHVGNELITFDAGGNSGNSNGALRYPKTGHLMYKRMSRRVYNFGSNPKSEYRPPMLHRLAEFYLLYAEALNEVSPSDPRIIEYVDKIRERAGIPLLATINSSIIGNQDAQREAIRAEMRVELATEGQRYHDLRRWMIADDVTKQGKGCLKGPFYGMDLAAPREVASDPKNEKFYKRTVIHERIFDRAEYLMPLPQNEIFNSKVLKQNPGY